MENRDAVEYYDGVKLVARIISSIVPPVGGKISIKGKTWEIVSVTYAIDYAESINERSMRANVDLQEVE